MSLCETMVTLVGTVTSEPVERRTAKGLTVCSFRVATNERRYNRQQDRWYDGDPMYATVICWRDIGRSVAVSLGSGDPVVVVGRMRLGSYDRITDRGQVLEIIATAVGPDLSRCTAVVTRQSGPLALEILNGVPDDGDAASEQRAA